jgi:hypothetical protein
VNTTDNATGLIREVLLRSIMLKWIERDIDGVKRLPNGHIWVENMYEPLHVEITSEMNKIKRTLKTRGIFVFEQRVNKQSSAIEIGYKEGGYVHSAVYPITILDTEAREMLRRLLKSKFPGLYK